MLALLAKQSLQEKVRGEQRVLPLINKWLNLILTGRLLNTNHLLFEAEISDPIYPENSGSQILFFR
jgi:hypothetical protein